MTDATVRFYDLLTESREGGFLARYAGDRPDLQGKTGRAWYSRIEGCWVFAVSKATDIDGIYRNAPADAVRRKK